METITLAVVTDDSGYGRALSRGLQHCSRGFVIDLFERERFLERWREEGADFRAAFDLVLWDGEELSGQGGGDIIQLAGHVTDADAQIRKYLPAGALAAEIFRFCELRNGRRPAGQRSDETAVITFASWQGGSGCSTIAMAVGQELTGYFSRKVLYLTLDEIESTGEYFDCPAGIGEAGEYLYRLFHARGEGAPFPERFLVRDGYGLEALAPSRGKNPMRDLSMEEMEQVILDLMSGGGFDAVLIDAGTCCSDAALAAMQMSDTVCGVFRHGQPRRESAYRSFLRNALGARGGEFLRVRNGADGSRNAQDPPAGRTAAGHGGDAARRGRLSSGQEEVICIAAKKAVSNEILREGEFANNIHALTERLWYNYKGRKRGSA